MTDHSDLITALAAPDGQPDALFDAMYRLVERTVGAKLFTMMSFNYEADVSERFYSNMPDAYPVSGTKPLNKTVWGDQLLQRHEIFVANDIQAIAAVFADSTLIQSLGCESVMNIPIVVNGKAIGTINCLHEAGHYTPERVAAADELRLPGTVCLLMQARRQPGVAAS